MIPLAAPPSQSRLLADAPAADLLLPERYLVAGLDAICRSHIGEVRPPPYHLSDGFIKAHRGAGMMASYYLFRDRLVDPAARGAVAALLDQEWMGLPLFAPAPAEAAAPAELGRLLAALADLFGTDTGNPHQVIFPSFVLRAFREQPQLVTPWRIAGLLEMIELEKPAPPLQLRPLSAAGLPEFELGAFSDLVLRACVRSLVSGNGYDQSYSGHVLTWGLAVADLHALGYHVIARKAELSYRNYLRRCLEGDEVAAGRMQRAAPPAHPLLPDAAAFWAARPVGNLEHSWAHLPKYAYAFLALLATARDGDVIARSRQLYYHLVY
jgi:hypothetical protein